MNAKKFTIIRDTRENKLAGWNFPISAYCNGTIKKKVWAGDYTVLGLEKYVCIERKKSINEFAQNCVQKRWHNCMDRMSQCKFKFLLFEFSFSDVENYPHSATNVPAAMRHKLKVPPKYIIRIIEAARKEYGIHVLFCKNAINAERAAFRILKKAHEISLRH